MSDMMAPAGGEAGLVGREAPLADLGELLSRAMQYQTPQTVVLAGTMGVGKTRLVEHFVAAAREQHLDLRIVQAAARPGGPSYGVFTRLLRARFGLQPGEEGALESLRAQVEEVLEDRRLTEVLHFLGSFLDISVPDNPFLRALEEAPAAQQDQVARTILTRFLEQDAQVSPLLLVLEDLHLADAQSVSLFRELAEGLEGCPLLLLGTARPELFARHPELDAVEAEYSRLDLPLLSEAHSAELLAALLGTAGPLPPALVATAVERSAGNPRFLQQLVSILLERGIVRREGEALALDAERLVAVSLPLSMEEATAVRVSMLSPAERDVLEKAATLGKHFWLEALVCFSRLQQEVEQQESLWMADVLGETIRELLDELERRDYVVRCPRSTIAGTTEYAFAHEQECALVEAMVPPRRKRQYHRFAGQWLETRTRRRTEAQLLALGRHYEVGGDRRKAAFCYVHAGDKARTRYAHEQARAYYQQGLALLDLDDVLSKIEALHHLGDVCAVLGHNEQALAHFTEMLRSAWLLDHRKKGGEAHRRIGRVWSTLGDYERALTHLNIALKLLEGCDDQPGVATTLDEVGKVAWLKGEYESALEMHRRALEILREEGSPRAIARTLNHIGRVHQDSGSFQAARECFEEAMELREEADDRLGLVDSLTILGQLARAQSEYGRAFELWTEALVLAQEMGARLDEAYLRIFLGEAKLQLGKARQADQQLAEALALAEQLGDRRLRADCARGLCEVKLALGELEAAGEQARQACEIARELGLKPEMGLALRALAEVQVAGELDDEERERAEALFAEAIEIFSELGNDLELARTFASFARYHDRLGAWDDADHFRSSADDIFSRLK